MGVIGNEIIKEVEDEIGTVRVNKAKKFVEQNRVKIISVDLGWDYSNILIHGIVIDNDGQERQVRIRTGINDDLGLYTHNCSCKPYSYIECEHILAVLLEFNNNPKYIEKINLAIENENREREKREFRHILENFRKENLEDELVGKYEEKNIPTLSTNIDIIPVIKKNKYNKYELSFKIGEKKMYKIKNIEEFYKNYVTQKIYRYGDNLVFEHKEENFSKNAKEFLHFILKYGKVIAYGNIALENRRKTESVLIPSSSLLLEGEILDDFFGVLKNKPAMIELDGKKEILNFMNMEGNIKFNLEEINEEEYKLSINTENIKVLNGSNVIYTILGNDVYEYDKKKYAGVFSLISQFEMRGKTEYRFEKEELLDFVNVVLPSVRDNISLEKMSETVINNYIPKKLATKAYLDVTDKGDILATIKFCYDDIEFEPYSKKIPKIPRDITAENKVLQRLNLDGFVYDRNYESFIIKNEESIYNFLMDSINYYMKEYEVLVSEEFKKREIRRPKISSLGVRIQNNLLNIDLSGLDFDTKELKDILEKYKLKKKYYRLKNGEFLSLEKNDDLDFIENLTDGMSVDYTSLSKGRIKLPVNRSLYLNKMLDNMENVEISEDRKFKDIITSSENSKIDEEIVIPEELDATLRTYQKTGYKWLKVLDKYKFGGILADDMGLRKNIASNCSYLRC